MAPRQLKRWLRIVFVLVVVAMLARIAPSYSHVRVTGPDGEIVIEQFGSGPQHIEVHGLDWYAKSSLR